MLGTVSKGELCNQLFCISIAVALGGRVSLGICGGVVFSMSILASKLRPQHLLLNLLWLIIPKTIPPIETTIEIILNKVPSCIYRLMTVLIDFLAFVLERIGG